MNKILRWWVDLMPYIGLAIAIALSSWSFVRFEQYRENTETTLIQTYEIQRRTSQIRERLTNLVGYMRLSIFKMEDDPYLSQEIHLLRLDIISLRNLEYSDLFLEYEDLNLINKDISILQSKIYPILSDFKNYQSILRFVYEIRQDMLLLSDRIENYNKTLNETAHMKEGILRNIAIFAITLSAIIFVGLFIYQRASFVRRRDQLIRSFASLFVHMTRTRVTGLSLFVKSLRRSETPDPEMVAAADQATEELASINEGLLKIAHSGRSSRQEPLAATMATLLQNHGGDVRLDVKDDAGEALVPAPQFHLILDELVRNAQRAVAASGVTEPAITVRGHLARRSLLGRHLILEVNDNGVGMRADILKEAKKPFFSTRAGAHVGLGLTGCAEMVKALGGKFRIKSTYGVGTSIRIVYPLS